MGLKAIGRLSFIQFLRYFEAALEVKSSVGSLRSTLDIQDLFRRQVH